MKKIILTLLVSLSIIYATGCQNNTTKKVPVQNSTTNTSAINNTPQTSKPKEQQIAYKQYTNNRYGYSIDYPSDFFITKKPDNGDGLGFQSSDGKSTLSVWGSNSNSVLNKTVTYEYTDELAQHKNVSYKKQEGNWFVISWTEGDNIVYEKYVVGNGSENAFMITYPTSQKGYYDTIVYHLVETLKTPDIDTVH